MSDYRETFKRKEVKYILSASQRERIEREVRKHMQLTSFGESHLCSLYFDTSEHSVIERSLEKPLYKEKIRLRWYDASTLEDAEEIFLELKKKFKGIVYKRRVRITIDSGRAFLTSHDPDDLKVEYVDDISTEIQDQIFKEIRAAFRRKGDLVPAASICYMRTPYEEEDPQGLRITFDRDLTGCDLIDGSETMSLLERGVSIMEIKCNGSYPIWLARILSESQTYPQSFSKYGELYKKGTHQRKERMKHAG